MFNWFKKKKKSDVLSENKPKQEYTNNESLEKNQEENEIPFGTDKPKKSLPVSQQVEDHNDDVPDIEKEVQEAKTRPAPYHISLNKENGKWRVRKAGSAKVIKYFDTQKEAIEFAQERAKNNENTIVIHKKDGKIRKQKYDKKD